MVRMDMAVNGDVYPFVRKSFNKQGQRQFAYMGSDRPEKGLYLLAEVFRRCNYQLHTYGNIAYAPLVRLPNVHHHGFATTVPLFGSQLCQRCDAFLNTSISDANPTTLLEASAWGLPAACTPQSGYYGDQRCHDLFWGLNPADPEGIVNLLHHINSLSEDELMALTRHRRQVVEKHYSWKKFLNTIGETLDFFNI